MTSSLTFDEFQSLAQKANRIAVFRAIPLGSLTAIEVYRHLNAQHGGNGVIFEVSNNTPHYSYLGFNPMASLCIYPDENCQLMDSLRQMQSAFEIKTRDDMAPLITHALGFIGYDAVRYFETLPKRHNNSPLPICLFHFYGLCLTLDHANQSLLISTVVQVGVDLQKDYHDALQALQRVIDQINDVSQKKDQMTHEPSSPLINVDIPDDAFMRHIQKAKDYIRQGDVFQVVLSRCFRRPYSVSTLDIYQSLTEISPSPFLFYFPTETSVIVGASPERLIAVSDKTITINPIAGTRRRNNMDNEKAIEQALLNDTKEVAEHMMLVDLARNDLGAVSQPGTVAIDSLMHVKHFSHVSHITSRLSGEMAHHVDAFDALVAAFPAGTLSGAPKIRAMELIDELESSSRGLYGGAVCRIDAKGQLDSCIAIRMAILQDNIATIRAGAGIVHDSNPASEAFETRIKAQALLHAIAHAHGENHDPHYR